MVSGRAGSLGIARMARKALHLSGVSDVDVLRIVRAEKKAMPKGLSIPRAKVAIWAASPSGRTPRQDDDFAGARASAMKRSPSGAVMSRRGPAKVPLLRAMCSTLSARCMGVVFAAGVERHLEARRRDRQRIGGARDECGWLGDRTIRLRLRQVGEGDLVRMPGARWFQSVNAACPVRTGFGRRFGRRTPQELR